jgi:hypothetical protein
MKIINKKKYITKRTKRTKKTRKQNIKTRKQKGSGDVEKRERIIKQNFRNMFLRAFNNLKSAFDNQNEQKINQSIIAFNNGFRSNQIGINTLIPITDNYIPINKENNSSATPITGFVPLLVVIFNNINNLDIQEQITNSFILNKGNINLKSIRDDHTALSTAVDLNNRNLIEFLLQHGADVQILTDSQQVSLNAILNQQEIEEIIEPEPVAPINKLVIPTELPSIATGYDTLTEPEFWKPIFGENEMTTIRENINHMMNLDGDIPIANREVTDLWSVCKIVQAMIPTYYTQTKNELYQVYGAYFSDTDTNFSHFNIILCAALIIYGIISNKMIGQDYKLLFKGGKAIQLVLREISSATPYKTEDIDVLVMPNNDIPYNEANVKNLAGHVAYLIRWFLHLPANQYNISVQPPNPENIRANPYIFKLSYAKVNQNRSGEFVVTGFKQFSDIDFKQTPENINALFEKSLKFTYFIEELNQNVLFICPNIGSLLDEKLYYYSKYFGFKKMLQNRQPVSEEGYTMLTIDECNRILEKFQRAILAMNNGLQKQRFPELSQDELIPKERNAIMNRLNKLGLANIAIKEEIIASLYS